MTIKWSEIEFDSDPLLVVLIRNEERSLTGRLLSIDENVFDELRAVAESAASRAADMDPVPYSPYVGLDADEYLALDRSAVVAKPKSGSKDHEGDSGPDETVALLGIVDNAEYCAPMGAGSVEEVSPDNFAGHGICFGGQDNRVGFVTRTNPRKVLKRSLIPLGRSDDNDRLKRVTSPELVLEPDIHAVVSPDEIAIFNQTQFQYLVTDATLLADHVPAQVLLIETAFKGRGVTLAQTTAAALVVRAQQQPRLARRLAAFADRIEKIDLAALTSGKGFKAQDLKTADFINSSGELECAPERVVELLDALEGRFFNDAFSPEKRRADRFRPR